jgi:hypothetical protein
MSERDLNWVERRQRSEKHLADSKILLWSDVCVALTEACKSFNEIYGGTSQVTRVNGHRLHIVLGPEDRVEVDFDNQACRINASYIGDPSRFRVRNFAIKADHLSAYIIEDGRDKDRDRLTPDEISECILASSFVFPKP